MASPGHRHEPDVEVATAATVRAAEPDRADAITAGQHRMALPAGAGNRAVAAVVAQRLDAAAVAQRMDGEDAAGGTVDHGAMVDQAISGGGQSLEGGLRRDLEAHVGTDLSGIRVHTGAKAHEASTALQAEAFTVKDHLVFRDGMYNPSTADGQHRIAHEVEHYVQQRSGPVSATDTGTGVALSDPSDTFEQAAEESARRFTDR